MFFLSQAVLLRLQVGSGFTEENYTSVSICRQIIIILLKHIWSDQELGLKSSWLDQGILIPRSYDAVYMSSNVPVINMNN